MCNSTKVLNINILVLLYYSINQYYSFHSFYGDLIEKELQPLCVLEYKEDAKLYQLLYFNNEQERTRKQKYNI